MRTPGTNNQSMDNVHIKLRHASPVTIPGRFIFYKCLLRPKVAVRCRIRLLEAGRFDGKTAMDIWRAISQKQSLHSS